MATIQSTIVRSNDGDVITATWDLLTTTNSDGLAVGFESFRDSVSIQVTGTIGVGFSLSFQGSNDGGTTWATLSNQAGSALTITALGIKSVSEATLLIRPLVTAGDGTTSVKVIAVLRRGLSPRQ